jgi:hypothetical protein
MFILLYKNDYIACAVQPRFGVRPYKAWVALSRKPRFGVRPYKAWVALSRKPRFDVRPHGAWVFSKGNRSGKSKLAYIPLKVLCLIRLEAWAASCQFSRHTEIADSHS